MRRFLLLAHRVPTGGQFTLNDLAGGGGRVDEVARSVSTVFTLSNDLRRDTELTILFVHPAPPGPRRMRWTGARLRHLNPDERSTAALVAAILAMADAPHSRRGLGREEAQNCLVRLRRSLDSAHSSSKTCYPRLRNTSA